MKFSKDELNIEVDGLTDEEAPNNSQTLSWEPVEGAIEYRMIIRDDDGVGIGIDDADDAIGGITNKDVVTETRYQFNWDERDVEHRIRYRTQYRMEVGGEWVDMDEYEYIHPPGSSVLRKLFGITISSDSGGNISVSESGVRKYSLTEMIRLDKEFSMREGGN